MPLAALATTPDLEARLGRDLSVTEMVRAQRLLDDASAAVRKEAGQSLSLLTTTVRMLVRDGRVRLTQRPIVSVDWVKDVEGNIITVEWDGLETLEFASADNLRFDLDYPVGYPGVADVRYTHGYTEIPADIVAVVCQIVMRALGVDADKAGVTQETAGPFSYSVGAAAAAGAVGMLGDEREIVRRYRRVGGVAWLR